MSYLFLAYPKCNTCRNAKKWLDEHKITYENSTFIYSLINFCATILYA